MYFHGEIRKITKAMIDYEILADSQHYSLAVGKKKIKRNRFLSRASFFFFLNPCPAE